MRLVILGHPGAGKSELLKTLRGGSTQSSSSLNVLTVTYDDKSATYDVYEGQYPKSQGDYTIYIIVCNNTLKSNIQDQLRDSLKSLSAISSSDLITIVVSHLDNSNVETDLQYIKTQLQIVVGEFSHLDNMMIKLNLPLRKPCDQPVAVFFVSKGRLVGDDVDKLASVLVRQ